MTFYYPRKWNGRQVWDWNMEACEVTVRFIYPHIHLFHGEFTLFKALCFFFLIAVV